MKLLFVVQDIDYIDPLGLMTISAVARRAGHETRLGVLAREDVLALARAWRPRVVAYSASTGEHRYYTAFDRRLKESLPEAFSILGGAHATFYPECVDRSTLDAVCVGEGEGAFDDLLATLGAGRESRGIPNLRLRSANGEDTQRPTPLRPLIDDLDSIPFPDRDVLYRTTEMRDFPLKSFMASRGCPYPCTYCFNHAYRRLYAGGGAKPQRRRSVEKLLAEIEQVAGRFPVRFVKFYDDIFSLRADEWLEDFARAYRRRIGLPFHCLTRPDLLDEPTIRLLVEAGCRSISMSIESGSQRLREGVLERRMKDATIVAAFDLCRRHGVNTFSNNILGLPGAGVEDEVATLDLNLRCHVSFAEFPIFHPYPRTQLGDRCIERGEWNGDFDRLAMSYMGFSPLTSFDRRQKNVQKNLSELGTVVVWLPWLRNLVVRHLVYWRPNPLFFLLYYVAKAWLVTTRVYPFRFPPGLLWRMFLKSIRLEAFKRESPAEAVPEGASRAP